MGRPATIETDPNEARRVVWARGENNFFWCFSTYLLISMPLIPSHREERWRRRWETRAGAQNVLPAISAHVYHQHILVRL